MNNCFPGYNDETCSNLAQSNYTDKLRKYVNFITNLAAKATSMERKKRLYRVKEMSCALRILDTSIYRCTGSMQTLTDGHPKGQRSAS